MAFTKDEIGFMNMVDASPACVVHVVVFWPDGSERSALFRTYASANRWLEKLPESCSTLFIPRMLDEPDWGNSRVQ